jgi:hypothetical protein
VSEEFTIWTEGPDDPVIKPLMALLEDYRIDYRQYWQERTPHKDELFPIRLDYQARYIVTFTVKDPIKADTAFLEALKEIVPTVGMREDD